MRVHVRALRAGGTALPQKTAHQPRKLHDDTSLSDIVIIAEMLRLCQLVFPRKIEVFRTVFSSFYIMRLRRFSPAPPAYKTSPRRPGHSLGGGGTAKPGKAKRGIRLVSRVLWTLARTAVIYLHIPSPICSGCVHPCRQQDSGGHRSVTALP